MSPWLSVAPPGQLRFLWWSKSEAVDCHYIFLHGRTRNPNLEIVPNSDVFIYLFIFDILTNFDGNFSYYYAGVMLDAHVSQLCSKLCRYICGQPYQIHVADAERGKTRASEPCWVWLLVIEWKRVASFFNKPIVYRRNANLIMFFHSSEKRSKLNTNFPNRPFYSCRLSDLPSEWQRG